VGPRADAEPLSLFAGFAHAADSSTTECCITSEPASAYTWTLDAAARVGAVGDLIDAPNDHLEAAAEVRMQAVVELRQRDMSYGAIAKATGQGDPVSRGWHVRLAWAVVGRADEAPAGVRPATGSVAPLRPLHPSVTEPVVAAPGAAVIDRRP